MKRIICLFGLMLVAASAAAPALHAWAAAPVKITVMTRNVYIGADIAEIATAPDAIAKFQIMAQIFSAVQATDFHARAGRLADEIAASKPHLIGLQEVALWRTQSNPADGPITPATTVAFDFLKILQNKLKVRGMNYEVAGKRTKFDLELPAIYPSGGPLDVRFTDRDVVLVRKMASLKVKKVSKKTFSELMGVPIGVFGDYNYKRGWIAVDGTFKGRKFRFINTHLEVLSGSVQEAQAAQLLSGPANTNRRLIMVGDFNSDSSGFTTSTYGDIVNAGFTDAWSAAQPGSAGFTCCQDGDLTNSSSQLFSRIDFVFVRHVGGGVTVNNAKRTGHLPAHRTASGLWPSDHAGVVARLTLL